MNNGILTVIEESKVEKETALTLQNAFSPFFNQAKEWAEKAKEIVVTDVSQVEEMKKAREARLFLKEIRINADKKRKELKEDSLRYGKAVQGVYNVIEYLITPIEKHLEDQEKFAEVLKEKMETELKIKRESELAPYAEFVPAGVNLAKILEDDFIKILNGAKAQHQMKIEADKKAEEDRIAKEKADAEEREKVRLENEKLKAEAEERERLLNLERERAAAEKAEQENKLKAEKEERERLEKEIKDKAAAEEKIRKEAEEKELQAKLAPDKDKLVEFSKLIDSLVYPDVSSPEAKHVISETKILLNKVSMYLLRQSDQISVKKSA